MPIIENSADRLALRSGSTTLMLDKTANTASLQRTMLLWNLKPVELPLADVIEVKLDVTVDPASGAKICHTMLVMRDGNAWALAESDAGGRGLDRGRARVPRICIKTRSQCTR